jgi:hypothetical protein
MLGLEFISSAFKGRIAVSIFHWAIVGILLSFSHELSVLFEPHPMQPFRVRKVRYIALEDQIIFNCVRHKCTISGAELGDTDLNEVYNEHSHHSSRLLMTSVIAAGDKLELSQIEHFSPKGLVQDREYNPNQPVIDFLLQKGANSIPLLIERLDMTKTIECQIMDYWPRNSVGDIALVILSDFATDSSWKNSTIPSASWDEILELKSDRNIPAWAQLGAF